ncbi:MAG: phenylalanine--tRNA ligase subunit alpha, partial [Sphingobacteriaceae bacterium]
MQEKIKNYSAEINAFEPKNAEELENFRIQFLGRKGILNELFEIFKMLPGEEKKTAGKIMNEFKVLIEQKIELYKEKFENVSENSTADFDFTLPGDSSELGARHPVSLVLKQINDIFTRIGFTIVKGPQIEDDKHNFTALNFPLDHPARDMQDTLFIQKDDNDPTQD